MANDKDTSDSHIEHSVPSTTETSVSLDALKSSLNVPSDDNDSSSRSMQPGAKESLSSQSRSNQSEPSKAVVSKDLESKRRVPKQQPKEIGGRGGLDPVRYGDWEKSGRCIDF